MNAALAFDRTQCLELTLDSYSFNNSIAITWSVGSQENPSSSFDKAMRSDILEDHEKYLITTISTASNPHDISLQSSPQLVLGDICTLLRLDSSLEFCPTLVHRYWRNEEGLPSMVHLWAPGQTESHSFPNQAYREDDVSRVILTGPPAAMNAQHFRDNWTQPYGLLHNGLPFVVYRILLYCDDFQQSSQMSKAASDGVCYFLPLYLPVEKRCSLSSVRIISLTPTNTSTNDVLRYIIPDMVQATVHGLEGRTPSGTRRRIFLDVLGFVGDYPVYASVVDVLGHVGSAPCNHCSFRCLRNVTNNGSSVYWTVDLI